MRPEIVFAVIVATYVGAMPIATFVNYVRRIVAERNGTFSDFDFETDWFIATALWPYWAFRALFIRAGVRTRIGNGLHNLAESIADKVTGTQSDETLLRPAPKHYDSPTPECMADFKEAR